MRWRRLYARKMAAAADRIWDLQQTTPPAVTTAAPTREPSLPTPHNSDRNPPPRKPPLVAFHQPPQSGRDAATQCSGYNDNGLCWYHNKFQHKLVKRCVLTMKQMPHREETAEHTFQIKTETAMSFLSLSAFCFLPLQQRRWARDLLEQMALKSAVRRHRRSSSIISKQNNVSHVRGCR
jgi:hypothetical protein